MRLALTRSRDQPNCGPKNRMFMMWPMHKLTTLIIRLSVLSCTACADLPSATSVTCRIQTDTVNGTSPPVILFAWRKSVLAHISGDNYLELSYVPTPPTVRVYSLVMPHAPWTFGEKLLGRAELPLDDQTDGVTRLTIDLTPARAVLACARHSAPPSPD